MGVILLVILALFFLGAFPTWPYARTWGYGPSGLVGLLLIVLLILLFVGTIPWWGWGPPMVVRP
jgi:hypothetical protein